MPFIAFSEDVVAGCMVVSNSQEVLSILIDMPAALSFIDVCISTIWHEYSASMPADQPVPGGQGDASGHGTAGEPADTPAPKSGGFFQRFWRGGRQTGGGTPVASMAGARPPRPPAPAPAPAASPPELDGGKEVCNMPTCACLQSMLKAALDMLCRQADTFT